jgi:minor extracellular serine protease Vpr
MTRRLAGIVMAGALLAGVLPGAASAADPKRPDAPLPKAVSDLRLDKPITGIAGNGKVDQQLATATGQQRVIVRLKAAPVLDVAPTGAAAQKTALKAIQVGQDQIIAKARRLDSKMTILGRTNKASNLVMLKMDAAAVAKLAKDPAVASIKPVRDYTLDLTETVPYIGAKAVQTLGYKGAGVDVAILDSGIDYTHSELGGLGTTAAYQAAYGAGTSDPKNTTRDALFPTARVKGGYDFVGESWPNTAEAPDPDPIDSPDSGTALGILYGTDGGHGTHVADIIGGIHGVAPRANLYGVKVCSSISTACSGVALIEGMDWAMDPNGDGNLADHVDVINMSLGQDYGTVYDDDLSQAVQRATRKAGILVVASAGNGANKPYIAGTPSTAPAALSVAQTQVPSAKAYPLVINAPAAIAGEYTNTETVEWAPLGSGFSGDVVYVGRGCPADGATPADPYLADPAGKVALIDRGVCSISLKVDRATKAHATAVLLADNRVEDAQSFSFGGGDLPMVPTMTIQQVLGTNIKAQLAIPAVVNVSVSTSHSISLVGSVVGSSSRGPSSDNLIKPEIGAPGASVSAVSGSGTGMQAFGGTSGAAPMVTGAAALLRGAFPKRTPAEIKAVLMNTAETKILTNPAIQPGVLAPISRIGDGEVRVDRALKSPIAAWDPTSESAALSFGFVDGTANRTMVRRVLVKNYSNKALVIKASATFRYGNDKTNGAVTIKVIPSRFFLPAKASKYVKVKLILNARRLRDWTMNAGADGTNPAPLDLLEYDGYINFNRNYDKTDDANPVHVAWHVLPRKAGDVRATAGTQVTLGAPATSGPFVGLPIGTLALHNAAVNPAAVDVYSLVGTSPQKAPATKGSNAPVIDLKSVGVQTFLDPAGTGVCESDVNTFVYRIAVSTWQRQTTGIVPGEIDAYLDTNGDGNPDFDIFSQPASLFALSDGRSLTYVYDYAHDSLSAWFYTDQSTNDANTILTFCGDQIGMSQANIGDAVTMDVTAMDWFYSGHTTDVIAGMHVTPYGERYGAMFGTSYNGADIAAGASPSATVADFGATGTNPSETGLLLVLNADRGTYHGGAVKGRESMEVTIATP